MYACRLDSAGSTPPIHSTLDCELSDLIPLVSMASYERGGATPDMPDNDLYAQLAQKEQDLYLAAELGKALLEKNQELSTRNEQLIEEYSAKIEELEQERHELHLRLEKMEAEYENTVKELQFDIGQLRHELQSNKQQGIMGDKDKTNTIRYLKQQNDMLSQQLKQASYRGEELEEEVQTLRDQMSSKRTSMHEHVHHLEHLREEMGMLQEKKMELEKRIASLTDERDAMVCSLEEQHDRIIMLEKQKQEKDLQLHRQHREVLELQETNAQLVAQVEHLSKSQASTPGHHCQQLSLFGELSAMSPGFENSVIRDEHPLNVWQRSMSAEMLDEDDIECDDDMSVLANSVMSNESNFLSDFREATASREDDKELRNEVIGTYKQLKKMVRVMKGESTCSTDDSDDEGSSRAGKLGAVLGDLQQLMQDMMTMHMERSDYSCDGASACSISSLSMDCMERSINELHTELITAQKDLEKVQAECAARDHQLMQKSQEFAAMAHKMSRPNLMAGCCFPWMAKLRIKLAPRMVCYLLQEQQERLVHIQKERDSLQDTVLGELSEDGVLEQTRRDRDMAMERGHHLEMELAKAKMDLMTLNTQLVGAIKQKVTLSQELDQWQNDMEHLLQYEMQQRIEQEPGPQPAPPASEAEQEHMTKSTSAASFFNVKKS